MRRTSRIRLLGFISLVLSSLVCASAFAQSTAEEYAAGCRRSCVGEATGALGTKVAEDVCGDFCACSLDVLREQLAPHKAASFDLNLEDMATLRALNAARNICIQKVLAPAAK